MSTSRQILLDPGVSRFVPRGAHGTVDEAPGLRPGAAARPQPPPGPDLDALRRQAFAEGEAKARREAIAERQRVAQLWQRLEAELDVYQENVRRDFGEQLVRLSTEVAGMILRRQLPDGSMIMDVLRETLGPVIAAPGLKVHLHPEDAALLKDVAAAASPPLDLSKISIVEDGACQPGDLIIESPQGWLDGRVSERLRMAEEKLRERFRRSYERER